MTAFSRRSGDVSYYNGPNPDISGFENIFVCTMRLNQGGVDVTTYARAQTAWVAQHLGFSSEYVFNGPFDAYSVGVAFAQQCLLQFVVGKSGILIDCEDEGATGTHSWGPDECIRFAQGVRSIRPDIPVGSFFCYMNYTVNRRFNWSACVGIGMGLVYARPGGPDDFQYWPGGYDRYIKQDGTVNGIDADWHNTPWLSIVGGAPAQQFMEEEDVIVLVSTPAQSGTGFDWWVQNISNQTYYHIDNYDQLVYLRSLKSQNGTGIEVHENQPVDVLAGYTLVTHETAELNVDANALGAAIGAAIKFPGYKATTEVVPS